MKASSRRGNSGPPPHEPAVTVAGALASARHTRERAATLRTRLISTPARIAHSAHRQTLHLPQDWPWEPGLDELFRRALHDPLPKAS